MTIKNPRVIHTQSGRARGLLILVLLALGLAALVWHIRGQHPTQPMPRHGAVAGAMPVAAAVARASDVPIELSGLGTVTPLANITVKTQIAGQLMQVGFKEGQVVRQGDFLAQIDPRPYQNQLEQAQGALTRDQALLANARVDLARYQTLLSQDSIAEQQVVTQKALVQQYAGAVQTDRAAVDTAKLDLVYCHITAPVSGRVGLRQVDPGNYVQPSDASGLVVLTQLQPISVIFVLPEDNVPEIGERLRTGASLPVTAYDRSGATQLSQGMLTAIDNQIDPSTGTVKLRAQFDNRNFGLFPNQFVNATLLVDTLKNAIVVPAAAIQRGTPGTYVYLIKSDDTVTVRPVTLGPASGQDVAITAGLEIGDKVVVDGADKLKEGAAVTLPAEQGAVAAPESAGKPSAHKHSSGAKQ